MKSDQIFDGLADKFAANIYGTTKGRLRHQLLCEALEPWLPETPARILEIGGGTGVMAHFLAQHGHNVVLTDASEDVLVHAKELLSDTAGVTIRHARLQDSHDIHRYDMLVCHAVLEWLDNPMEAIAFMAGEMQKGSLLSLSFFNRDALLFGNALYGNFDYIEQGMQVKKKVRLNPHNPLPVQPVIEACEQAGLTVRAKTGIRCFHDYLKDRDMQTSHYEQLLALERTHNQRHPYLWLGKYFHLMLEK
ncbi:methyltransferase [Alteromonas halophila]|uniref:tRNA 5-carboxymethoxyuridine methyltransferase n=1 Tax=Alteromonas halophila TaxID=516698 RepID=A0A918JLL7_9ALTE|nr:methyltransferase domain-containing protein [Alteromonas halophila]GGW88225.1 tRNA 5-carboxymethoxyuridine methyltransferase [Alteromonas halophila]